MVLPRYVRPNKTFDQLSFIADLKTAVRFLDDVLDANVYVDQVIQDTNRDLRRIGLGIMGLHDALALMGVEYGSPTAVEITQSLGQTMASVTHEASTELARKRGQSETLRKLDTTRRNVATLTVAPTGTTSNLMGCSSGIEPFFALKYKRRVGGEYITVIEPTFLKLMTKHCGDEEKARRIIENLDLINAEALEAYGFTEMARVLKTSNELSYQAHVNMQGAFQRGIDSGGYKLGNAISKTLNLPKGSTADDVEAAYLLAYSQGCKGVTVYVDGSFENQVLTTEANSPASSPEPQEAPTEPAVDTQQPLEFTGPLLTAEEVAAQNRYVRPGRLSGYTDVVELTDPETGGRHKYYVTVNHDGGKPVEVIVSAGKGGSRSHGEAEAMGRLTSLALQSGVTAQEVSRALSDIDAGLFGSYERRLVRSPAALISVMLEQAELPEASPSPEVVGDTQQTVPATKIASPTQSVGCPQCGGPMRREEGCSKCSECGYAKCG
ncbi:hypothetical protein Dxin01_00160 [Deinococcus xinjiangensis]|uniref:Vitamin B12-dependent ribonucleotide reductase n=2 Tax=Deinococcus xinjiangensis TaxID=457454 RepID=A0ABP9V580_9DEIO